MTKKEKEKQKMLDSCQRARVRDYEDGISIPVLIMGEGEGHYAPLADNVYPSIQMERLEDEEYNIVVYIDGKWIRAKSIDFDFVD